MIDYYAGIGSRITPENICSFFIELAKWLESRGLGMRSGGAVGADKAFADGVIDPAHRTIYRAWHATPEAIAYASKFHPKWDKCSGHAKALHGRNAMIVLGEKLNQPAKFVVCWSANESYGGTSMGIKIARDNDIPVYNACGWDKKLDEFYRLLEPHLAA